MAKRTGPTNQNLRRLIEELNILGSKEKVKVWKVAAKFLNRPTRKRIKVNILKINKLVRDGETALIPGKVLSDGELTKKATVAGFQFSETARLKINKIGKAITINQLIKENPKGKKIRLIC